VAMDVFKLDNSAGLNVEEGFGGTLLHVALDTGVGGDSAVQILVTFSVLVVVLIHQEQCPLLTWYKIGGEICSFCCSHGCVVETKWKLSDDQVFVDLRTFLFLEDFFPFLLILSL
jgi:hypothetical protein